MIAAHCRATFKFWRRLGRLPQLCPPVQHYDKFFWRKILDHNPDFEIFCDKLACKNWVRDRCPDLEVPATLWQGTSARDIPDELLNRSAFIKANNGSGYNIRLEGSTPDRKSIEASFARWLSGPFGQGNAEWGYRHVPLTVFVEEIICTASGESPVLINVFASGGEPSAVYCATGWKDSPRYGALFDIHQTRKPTKPEVFGALPDDWRPPSGLGKAIEFARVLARDTDHMRCDFLCIDDKVWFSEMTPYTMSGLGSFGARDGEEIIYGEWDLAQSWFLRRSNSGWKRWYAQALFQVLDTHHATS